MWPARNSSLIIILFEQNKLIITLVEHNKSNMTLVHSETCTFTSNGDGYLFNIQRVTDQITSFLKQVNIKECFAAFGLSDPLVVEKLVIGTQSKLEVKPDAHHIKHVHYLYPTDNAHFCFLVTSLDYSRLFQYQLLAHATSLNLVTITSSHIARINRYRSIQGSEYRQSQFAQQMKRHHNDLNKLHLDDKTFKVNVDIDASVTLPIAGLAQMSTGY